MKSDAEPTAAPPPENRHSGFARVFRLARKELREILRDRRTVITLVAMPILLYPLMSIVFRQMYLANRATTGPRREYLVGALTLEEWLAFERRFHQGREIWAKRNGITIPKEGPIKDGRIPQVHFQPDPLRQKITTEQDRAEVIDRFQEELREHRVHLLVTIDNIDKRAALLDTPIKDQAWHCRIFLAPTYPDARAALADIEQMFALANEQDLKDRLGIRGVQPRTTLLSVERVTVDVPGGTGAISLAALVPLILILMTITGAVYPAIDLTAGERERGTLEILVAAPVSRFELLGAKYLSVVVVAILTAVVNLLCMMITVKWSGLGAALFREQEFSIPILLQILALLILFAAFFSALLLCLTSFARSFKEAQAYLIPLMLASLTPGVMAMLPGLKLDGILRVLPLVNIVLMARDLFEAGVPPLTAATVVLTTLFYALAALSLAARVFGAETVLYSEQSGWADLLRRPDTPQPAATLPMALWCLAMLVPLHFSLTALSQAMSDVSLTSRLLFSIPVNLLLFGCFPALFLYFGRVDLVPGLALQPGKKLTLGMGLVAGVILGSSLWPLELFLLVQNEVAVELRERYGSYLEAVHQAQRTLGWGVLAVVIVPAILEELFFRGFLYQALATRVSTLATIGLSGLLFGLMHVVLDGALGLERLAPSTLLGLVLSAVRWRTGSVWSCVVLHVCHNAILLTVGIASPGSTEDIPWTWLAAGAAGALAGGFTLWYFGAQRHPRSDMDDQTRN